MAKHKHSSNWFMATTKHFQYKLGVVWKRTTRQLRRKPIAATVIFLIILGIFSYMTNPFVSMSIVKPAINIQLSDSNEIEISKTPIFVRQNVVVHGLAQLKAGWHIVSNRFNRPAKTTSAEIDAIIEEIHELRFDPNNDFLISGDHFSVMYPRSLGIFYASILDSRTALSEADWLNRQVIYLKTLLYTLAVYSQTEDLSTTIIPISPQSVVLINIYAYPSDTLYSMLYAMSTLLGHTSFTEQLPYTTAAGSSPLVTQPFAQAALTEYADDLTRHYYQYKDTIWDPETQLVRTDILLSGTKDIARRRGAFYDNVIFWRTTQLAQELGLIPEDPEMLASTKQTILDTFWNDSRGCFAEDQSKLSSERYLYSSDWLIAVQTRFLDIENESERQMIADCITYIQDNAIDQPFGLQYQADLRRSRAYLPVRIFAPSYASTAIWSHWGMEYIKALNLLYQATGDARYLRTAEDQVNHYTYNIKRYRGYPEVYNSEGDFFSSSFYKSVRRTGWIVNYEQTRAITEWNTASAAGQLKILGAEDAN